MYRKFVALLASLFCFLCPHVTNASSTFQADVESYIAEKTLPLAKRQLVSYQFGDKLRLEQNRGTTYTASRWIRLPLPFAQLAEGVAPPGEPLTLQQVTATAQQWGDRVIVTDVADITIKHPVFKTACQLVALQMKETLERNTYNALMAGVQINYANGRSSRANLLSTDVMTPTETNRIWAALQTYGAPQYGEGDEEDEMVDAGAHKNNKTPAAAPHYVAITHPVVMQDMRSNSLVATAFAFSDVDRLYTNEFTEWGGFRWTHSNMVPYWTGVAQVNGTALAAGGNLATATYYIQLTASPAQTSVEQQIYQISTSLSVTGPSGAVSVALPNLANYVFNVYISTSNTAPTTLGLCSAGPVTGPMAGQATQLQGNQTVIITGIGASQVPPAAPATSVTVYPTFFLGAHAYGQVMLDDAKFFYLKDADKSDPLNQTRVVGWKVFYGTILLNQGFFARTEASSAYSGSYNSGTVTN